MFFDRADGSNEIRFSNSYQPEMRVGEPNTFQFTKILCSPPSTHQTRLKRTFLAPWSSTIALQEICQPLIANDSVKHTGAVVPINRFRRALHDTRTDLRFLWQNARKSECRTCWDMLDLGIFQSFGRYFTRSRGTSLQHNVYHIDTERWTAEFCE